MPAYLDESIHTARLPAAAPRLRPPTAKRRGRCRPPPNTAIENMVLAVADNSVTCYGQSLYNAKPTCPPSRHDDCTQAAWVCHWQSTGQAKSYSVDVGVQQGILCKSTELSTPF